MGFTFFVLLLGALIFTLAQKHEVNSRRRWRAEQKRELERKSFGKGKDNIYQFKVYCYNMRCLLELAQKDGIGSGEERNEAFYDKYRDEISKKYCDGKDPIQWCMLKAAETVTSKGFLNAWVFNTQGVKYVDQKARLEREMTGDYSIQIQKYRSKNTWTACRSGYELNTPASVGMGHVFGCLDEITLPKDGVSRTTTILRNLYNFNHEYDNPKTYPTFEESGITLYN